MKKIIPFSRYFRAAAIFSTVVIAFGLFGYAVKGFNLGVDFQAGINQTVQLAQPALRIAYAGKGNAELKVSETAVTLVFSGAEVQSRTVVHGFKDKATIGDLAAALAAEAQVTAVPEAGSEAVAASLLVPTYQGNTLLGPVAMVIHRAPSTDAERAGSVAQVREAIGGSGGASVQQINPATLQRYIIRVQDEGTDKAFSQTARDSIRKSLEARFGADKVVVLRTDYVGARYSQSLGRQSIFLTLGAIVMIMLYAWIRFRLQFGIGAVLAILHDALVMITFIVWTRMEFNTSTIAAILTILGYSINDTIVQFDRVREERKVRPTDKFRDVLDYALSITLGRTIITTVATMLTVLALFFFTSGSIKDFALALFVGMVSGTYSTIFIASGFVEWWETSSSKRAAEKSAHKQ